MSAFAMTVDFDADELWLAEHPANASRPGVLSQAQYGARHGVPALLELLSELKTPATFFVCGGDARRYPDVVRAIAAAGFELGNHGLTHRSPDTMSREQEAAELLESTEILTEFSPEIVGYRSPSWDFSPHTLDLLVDHGYEYSSNLMNSIHPYRHPHHPLNELPVHWILDDAPHFWFDSSSWNKTIRTSAEVLQLWTEEAEAIWELGGTVTLTVHPQFIGRPSRLRMLRAFLELTRERGVERLTARAAAARCPAGGAG